jgi:hypothetical protein
MKADSKITPTVDFEFDSPIANPNPQRFRTLMKELRYSLG